MSKRFVFAFIALFCAVLPISSVGQVEPNGISAADKAEQKIQLRHVLDVAASLQ